MHRFSAQDRFFSSERRLSSVVGLYKAKTASRCRYRCQVVARRIFAMQTICIPTYVNLLLTNFTERKFATSAKSKHVEQEPCTRRINDGGQKMVSALVQLVSACSTSAAVSATHNTSLMGSDTGLLTRGTKSYPAISTPALCLFAAPAANGAVETRSFNPGSLPTARAESLP